MVFIVIRIFYSIHGQNEGEKRSKWWWGDVGWGACGVIVFQASKLIRNPSLVLSTSLCDSAIHFNIYDKEGFYSPQYSSSKHCAIYRVSPMNASLRNSNLQFSSPNEKAFRTLAAECEPLTDKPLDQRPSELDSWVQALYFSASCHPSMIATICKGKARN